jgi:SlyX protein
MNDKGDDVTKLEELYCHQSTLVEQLSQLLYDQQRTIDQLALRLAAVERQLREGAAPPGTAPADDRPPHY